MNAAPSQKRHSLLLYIAHMHAQMVRSLWPSPRPWLRAWLVAIFLATALSALVAGDLVPDERASVREIQGWAIPGQTVADAVRAMTSTQVVLIVGVAIALFQRLTHDHEAALILVVLLVLLPATQAGIKELVDRPRPSEPDVAVLASASSPSFPAGHVMSPTVAYGWAIFFLIRKTPGSAFISTRLSHYLHPDSPPYAQVRQWGNRKRRLIALLLGALLVLTGIVNVQLGVHWPTDVVGGYLWGAALLLPALAIYSRPAQAR